MRKPKYLDSTCAVQRLILKIIRQPGDMYKLLLVCKLGFVVFLYLTPIIAVVCSLLNSDHNNQKPCCDHVLFHRYSSKKAE